MDADHRAGTGGYLPDSPLALGTVTTLQFLPVMLLSLFGGVIADRVAKRQRWDGVGFALKEQLDRPVAVVLGQALAEAMRARATTPAAREEQGNVARRFERAQVADAERARPRAAPSQAYERAKKQRAKDPRVIAMKRVAKVRRREAYQKAKAQRQTA